MGGVAFPCPSHRSCRATGLGAELPGPALRTSSKDRLKLPAAPWASPWSGGCEWQTPPRPGAPEVAELHHLPFLLNRILGPVLAQLSRNHGRRRPGLHPDKLPGCPRGNKALALQCLPAASHSGLLRSPSRARSRAGQASGRTHPFPRAAGRDHPRATGVKGGHLLSGGRVAREPQADVQGL